MKITFNDAPTAYRGLSGLGKTFVFVGKGYNYPAAALFARYLSRSTGKDIEWLPEPSFPVEGKINLLCSQEDQEMDSFLNKDTGELRVVPFFSNLYTTKARWGQIVDRCVVVEVTNPSPKEMGASIGFACTLAGVQFDKGFVEWFTHEHAHASWSDIFSAIEYAETEGIPLVGAACVPAAKSNTEVDYFKFKDSFLFGLPKDTVSMILGSEKCFEFSQRLVKDLALYLEISIKDSLRVPTKEVAQAFNQNEWFLRNRLLPRLRSFGIPRLLKTIDLLTDLQTQVKKGESFDHPAQMASKLVGVLF